VNLGQWVGFLAVVIAIYILWKIRQVLLLVFAAIVLATALNRVVGWLQRVGVKRGIAIGIVAIALLGILVGLFAIVEPPLVEQFQQLVNLVPNMLEGLRDWSNWVQTFIPQQLLNIGNLGNLIPRLQPLITQVVGNVYTWFSDLVAIILNLLLVFVLSIMLLANPSPYRRGFILLFPAFYRRRVNDILSECETTLVGWITATIFDMAVIGVVTFIGLSVLQVPLPLVNALLAGFLEFIPNVGPTLSVLPPVAVALLDSPWKAVAVVILYLLIQQFESYFLVPFVMKSQVDLLPAVTLLAVVIFGLLFGFLGILLALPLVIVLKIWLQELLVKDILNNWGEDERDTPAQESPTPDNGHGN